MFFYILSYRKFYIGTCIWYCYLLILAFRDCYGASNERNGASTELSGASTERNGASTELSGASTERNGASTERSGASTERSGSYWW